MGLREINKFLEDKKFIPSKKMGQNFLVNEKIKKMIVSAAKINKNDWVLEIGPGTGAITSILLTYKIKLVAFELDKRLFSLLEKKYSSYNNFFLVNVDALKINWDDQIHIINSKIDNITLVANLPYSISSLLVFKILHSKIINKAIIMVQKEMADRLAAKVNTKDYNAFSALIQLFLDIKKLFLVDSKNFSPPPKVKSTVIEITKKTLDNSLYTIEEIDRINAFFKLSFLNRRKTLINNLAKTINKALIIEKLKENNLDLNTRAEQLNPITLVKLMKELNFNYD